MSVSNSAESLPFIQRLLNSFSVYITYLFLTIYPVNLPVFMPYPNIELPIWNTVVSIILITFITSICILSRKKFPQLNSGWFWFLVTLIPMVGIISPGESVFIANRWTYIAHIGFFAGIIWTVTCYYEKHPGKKIYIRIF